MGYRQVRHETTTDILSITPAGKPRRLFKPAAVMHHIKSDAMKDRGLLIIIVLIIGLFSCKKEDDSNSSTNNYNNSHQPCGTIQNDYVEQKLVDNYIFNTGTYWLYLYVFKVKFTT